MREKNQLKSGREGSKCKVLVLGEAISQDLAFITFFITLLKNPGWFLPGTFKSSLPGSYVPWGSGLGKGCINLTWRAYRCDPLPIQSTSIIAAWREQK